MNKLIIIGIDGMDFNLFRKWEADLPNLKRISEEGNGTCLESIFPPDSISAWTTIFTGLDPSEHGLLYSINYLDTNKKLSVNTEAFKNKTFWDFSGKSGKRVCVVNPFMAYPPWDVNGVMVSGPVFISGNVSSSPPHIAEMHEMPEMGGIVDFPSTNELNDFYERARKNTEDLADYGLKLIQMEKWDLFFISFLTLDRVKHFMWRYQDPSDPTYPGSNKFHDSIKDFYVLLDKIVGRFLQSIDNDTRVMVISDHGHQKRCYNIFNMNEYLRREKYLTANISRFKYFSPKYWIERSKAKTLDLIATFNLEDYARRLIKFIPRKSELKKSTYITNFSDSYAYTDINFSGKNPNVGIRLNKSRVEADIVDYNDFRETFIKKLSAIKDPKNGKNIVLWIKKREDLFSGQYLDRYPDILIQLESEYGVDFSLFGKLFNKSVTHKKISGGHTKNGVFFLSGTRLQSGPKNLKDIYPLVLKLVGINK